MEMEAFIRVMVSLLVSGALLVWGWRILNWVWLKPKSMEKWLRQQGLAGNSYRFLSGDIKEMFSMIRQARSKPMPLSDDIGPYVSPFLHQTVNKYGKNSFTWFGPRPRVTVLDPEDIKEVFNKFNDFPKPDLNPLLSLLLPGLVSLNGDEWAKHRKIINPAFHQDKLKNMLSAFYESCIEIISEWEKMVSVEGSSEVDVWPYIVNLTGDAISRAAFGSSYEQGTRIFQLLEEQAGLAVQGMLLDYIPGWRFLPTKANKRMKLINKDIKDSLREMTNRRVNEIKGGKGGNGDLLGILVESNNREVEEHGMGMSIEEVVEECKLFYFAGQETTSGLLVWTMILLARFPDWQTKARDEVFQVFGDNKPDFDGLNRLKIVSPFLALLVSLYAIRKAI
ncbi:Cytochrome P450 [Corchorus capsularis]|uniref:Cytochrome P450 n=1 Tax=Corchorus capsularis TaxID=210143 RepID=A0A1R3HWA0_COCAP|nr:Cytochrome P450 [Corchorus capsularis]